MLALLSTSQAMHLVGAKPALRLVGVKPALRFSRTWCSGPVKSETCFGRISGAPLTEYHSESQAEEGARYANAQNGGGLVPYQCNACGYWHLSPRSRMTPSMPCLCVGRNGNPKALFFTFEDAQRRSELVRQEGGGHSTVYECELGLGWHLTKGYPRQ